MHWSSVKSNYRQLDAFTFSAENRPHTTCLRVGLSVCLQPQLAPALIISLFSSLSIMFFGRFLPLRPCDRGVHSTAFFDNVVINSAQRVSKPISFFFYVFTVWWVHFALRCFTVVTSLSRDKFTLPLWRVYFTVTLTFLLLQLFNINTSFWSAFVTFY